MTEGSPAVPRNGQVVHDFDEVVDRRGSDSKKWEGCDDVIPLWLADSDFKAPQPVVDALIERCQHGIFGYPAERSNARTALVGWLARRLNWAINEESVLMCSGAIGAIGQIILALSKPGDSVLTFSPHYPTFRTVVESFGRRFVECELHFEQGEFHVDFEDLETGLAKDAAPILLLCNPHNPSGKVFPKEELESILRVCRQHRVTIVADEVHSDIVRKGTRFTPIASLAVAGDPDIITVIDSNKAFNLGGLRTSALVIERDDLRARIAAALRRSGLHKISVLADTALKVSYAECDWYVDQLNRYIDESRRVIETAFPVDHSTVVALPAHGTYLVWLDCTRLEKAVGDPREFFLQFARVDLASGADFGIHWSGFLRLTLAVPRSVLNEVVRRMNVSLDRLL